MSLLSYPGENFFAERLAGSRVQCVQLGRRGRYDLGYPLRLRRWFREQAVDVVHAFILGPILWCHLATLGRRRPLVIPAERNMLAGMSAAELGVKRLVYRAARCVTANSEAAANEIREGFGISAERVVSLPNAIDLERWDLRARAPNPVELPPGRFHLGLIGRIAPQKNHELVLEALAQLGDETRDWCVWFVGDERLHPGLASELRSRVTALRLQDRVRFLPAQRDVAAFMARLDGVLLPSLREGFPNVVLEAMALGVPVVAARVGEVPNMIEHGATGLLIDPGRADDLVAALRALRAMSDDEREHMTAAARRAVEERYTVASVARRHLDLYRRLLGETG